MQIIWYKQAEQDLNESIAFIANESPVNALYVLDEIILFIDSLPLFPYKYPKEPIYNMENIRFVNKWFLKIIYRIESDNIYILRIFNTHQNPDKIKLYLDK